MEFKVREKECWDGLVMSLPRETQKQNMSACIAIRAEILHVLKPTGSHVRLLRWGREPVSAACS